MIDPIHFLVTCQAGEAIGVELSVRRSRNSAPTATGAAGKV
jgi:hypothetical protein